jgi:hypothetical protein
MRGQLRSSPWTGSNHIFVLIFFFLLVVATNVNGIPSFVIPILFVIFLDLELF